MDSQCQYAAIGRCEPMCLLISECTPLRFGKKRLIRAEMVKRGILSKEIAARLGISEPAVSQGCATSPRIVAEIIAAGVPAWLFGESRGQEGQHESGSG